jgi:exodeoxyribonuclease VII large subunit
LDDRTERVLLALPSLVARRRVVLTSVERRLPDPRTLTAQAREAVRDRDLRLRLSAPGLVATHRSSLDRTSQRLTSSVHRALGVLRGQAERVMGRVSEAPLRASLREARAHLAGLGPRLESASPMALLQRGYVLVTNPAGRPVTTAASVKPGGKLRLHFGDGEVDAIAQGGTGRGRSTAPQEQLDL